LGGLGFWENQVEEKQALPLSAVVRDGLRPPTITSSEESVLHLGKQAKRSQASCRVITVKASGTTTFQVRGHQKVQRINNHQGAVTAKFCSHEAQTLTLSPKTL